MLYFEEKNLMTEKEYDLVTEPQNATLFTTGNGYMGIRGSFEEFGSSRIQGAYIRGLFDEIVEVMEPYCDNTYMKKYYFDEQKLKTFENQDSCINFADFLLIRFDINGETFYPWNGEILSWKRYLDFENATLTREVVFKNKLGQITKFKFVRFASYQNRHLYVLSAEATAINYEGKIDIMSGIDSFVRTGGQRIVSSQEVKCNKNDIFYKLSGGKKYDMKVSISTNSRFYIGNTENLSVSAVNNDDGLIYSSGSFDVKQGDSVKVEKTVFVAMDRDEDIDNNLDDAVKCGIENYKKLRFSQLLSFHTVAWKEYFRNFDIEIVGDDNADRSLRQANYHTAISACMDSVHSVSAKNLTGERYNQFVWWDAEIYQLPIFMHAYPEVSKNALIFRYHLLEDAKNTAQKLGLEGAKFPFVCSVGGTEKIWKYARHPHLQIHVTSDIGVAIIKYYDNTLDETFLKNYGLEMLVEIIKFFISRSEFDGNQYVIKNVTGTDEHHPYVDNDAYTNYTVKLVAERLIKFCEQFPKASDFVSIKELEKIKDYAAKIYLPISEKGIIPQFDGYLNLSRTLQIEGSGTGKSFQMKNSGLYHKSQIIKQPDVMLLYSYINYPNICSINYEQNWDYYEKMCESSSSLSYPVHAICSADNNRMLSFYEYFLQTVRMDIDDIHKVAHQGVHGGCLAGGYYAIFRGIFGFTENEKYLEVNPNMFNFWQSVSINFVFHGAKIHAELSQKSLTIIADKDTDIYFCGKIIKLLKGCQTSLQV